MSQNQTISPADAADQLRTAVGHRAFFGKLAHAGIVPRTADEADRLLEIGDYLYNHREESLAKAASERSSIIDFAYDRLVASTGGQATPSDVAVKQAAYAYAAQPDILAMARAAVAG